MKKLGTISVIALLVVCLAAVGCLGTSSEGDAANAASNTTIAVSGTGLIKVVPNKVTVNLGVETQSENVTDAVAQNAARMDAVIAALDAAGVPKDNRETSYFRIFPVRSYERPDEGILGYRVTNEITVEVQDLEKVGPVIDTAISAGANTVNHVVFGLTEERERDLRQQALTEACADARTKADAIASGLGLKIVGVATVTEGGVYTYPYRAGGYDEYAKYAPAPSVVPTPIEPQDVTVSASIQVVYRCL
ncbi:MAG TPA: DUF541 domain-containing protein [Methanomicrobia archaeon]|nr:DUF541 domain-containing protein [Methanomicrobia archaeon]